MELKLLSCPLCLKPHFGDVDTLRSSLISVATSPISCPVCNELLMGLDKLTIHLFSHITDSITKSSKPELNKVQITEEIQPELPQISPQVISTQTHDMEAENMATPIIKLDKEEKESLRCDICNFCFFDENILEMHQKLLHQTQADKETGKCSYHCHLCSKKFKMRGSLMVHLRVAHYGFGHQTDEELNSSVKKKCSEKTTSNSIEKDGKDGKDNKQWACDVCSKSFTTKYFLKKHKRLHTGEMPYFCSQCNKSFTFQQSYHKHMLYHSSEKPHVCSECGRAFKELSTLHNHERIHSGERPFACETCGKCFRQRVSYLVHKRIHTGVMPYKCTACDKSFRYKVSQKSHKCPANPPGSVVRAPALLDKLIQKSNLNLSEVEQIVDNSSNSITIDVSQSNVINNNVNSIIFDINGQIVGQNFTCLQKSDASTEENDKITDVEGAKILTFVPETEDFFTMVMSPTLPDVQTLYLSSPGKEENQNKPPLDTINEDSFKKLLYGQSEYEDK